MVVWPALVMRHAIPALRLGHRRLLRAAYIAVAAALIVYFFAVYIHQPAVCVRPRGFD